MVNQRLWDMEDAEGSKEKFLWQVSLTQRGTQGKICTKLRTWRRGMLHEATNSAGTDACGWECSRECGAYGQEYSRVG